MRRIKEILRIYSGNKRGLLFIACFRIAHFFTRNLFFRIIGFPFIYLYRVTFNNFLGIDIRETTPIGKNLVIWHGMGLVVHPKTIIGNNVILHQTTTIGNAHSGGPAPIIGDNVYIGCNSVVLGGITIGCDSIIGAGSVVIKDVPPHSVVVGNPAKIIKQND